MLFLPQNPQISPKGQNWVVFVSEAKINKSHFKILVFFKNLGWNMGEILVRFSRWINRLNSCNLQFCPGLREQQTTNMTERILREDVSLVVTLKKNYRSLSISIEDIKVRIIVHRKTRYLMIVWILIALEQRINYGFPISTILLYCNMNSLNWPIAYDTNSNIKCKEK